MKLRLRDLPRYWGDLSPIQQEFERAAADGKRVVLRCGRQVGKTEYLARRTVQNLLLGKRCWWLAPTHQLCRVGFQRCVSLLRKLPKPVADAFRIKRSAPYRIAIGDAYCDFLTTRTPDSLQGETLDEVVIDEAATIRDLAQVVEQYVEPTLAVKGGTLILASTPKGRNDFAEYCRSEYWSEVHAPSSANPLISKEWLIQQRAKYEAEGRLFYYLQEFEAQVLEKVGLFFERLPEVVEEVPAYAQADGCGLDWGYSAPFAAVYVVIRDGVVYVSREVYKRRLNGDEQARLALATPARVYVADPSVPDHILEEWRAAGLSPKAGVADRVGGWDLIRQLIREGRLKVHKECFHLLDEFQQAEVDERKPDDLTGEDHALDALRYIMLHAFSMAHRQQRAHEYRLAQQQGLQPDSVLVQLMEQGRQSYLREARKQRRSNV